jgi:NADH-quinone oxidoreductase subunit H
LAGWPLSIYQILWFTLKVGFFLFLFVWVRWTLPRFRYDQLMDLGWKRLFPLALANLFITGVLVALEVIKR